MSNMSKIAINNIIPVEKKYNYFKLIKKTVVKLKHK